MNKPLFPEVSVDGYVIASADIAAEAQNHAAPKGKPGLAWRKAAQALIVRRLLLARAEALGLSETGKEVAPGKFETPEEANIRVVLEREIEVAAPDEARIKAVYEANPERYRAPSLYEAAHILFAAPDAAARGKARERAQAVLGILAKDPGKFHLFAKEQSDCSSRESGGRLGQISDGDTVPEFEAALARLEIGQMAAEPVESRYGLHIVRLDARAVGDLLPYASVRGRIAEALEKTAWGQAAQTYVRELIDGAAVVGIDLKTGVAA